MSSTERDIRSTPRERSRLVLASRSPRRSVLLREAGFEFDSIAPDLDDADLEPSRGATPAQWVAALAYLKARAAQCTLDETSARSALVLGADTICVVAGRIVGKPRDAQDAERMIGALSSRRHDVLTGAALVGPTGAERTILVDRARVEVGLLTPEEVARYVATGAWAGKAGGYNLSERLEAGWPIRFDGDSATIMGLPMGRLTPLLRARLGATGADVAPAGRVA